MFGYVLPVKCELRVRDYEQYRAIYCGVCKQLHQSHGILSRFLLNYDLVLLALLADALSGEVGKVKNEGCFANPFALHPTTHNTAGLALGSDALLLLSYHRLEDNITDEKGPKSLLYRLAKPLLRHRYKKAAARLPEARQVLARQMENQYALEQEGCRNIDAACEPTARMCEALFKQAARTEPQQQLLARIGLFAGQIVYLLDAAEDYEQDHKRGRYNVLLRMGLSKEEAVATVQRRCRMAAGELARSYEQLAFVQYKEILDNVFYLGLPAGIAQAGIKQNKRRAGHGQIQSV